MALRAELEKFLATERTSEAVAEPQSPEELERAAKERELLEALGYGGGDDGE